ncbi:hypothetical protein [Erythrobacter sp. SD-21]|uniref:hypothetical protein n=1 Tax=Erythrobacter sp. SD-21 TaxID=161528 RepID=UPI000153F665|nr:hypothetical protein [Erythrobacter sp. SD-21]EDL50522.1 hypothetical protein ED21_28663 [Erythrobacter sp. SD-21]
MTDFTAVLDITIAIVFAGSCSFVVRSLSADGRLKNWWFWIAVVPLLSLGLAISIMLFPRTGSLDFNAGRADFVALTFYGLILPVGYLLITIPLFLIWRSIKKRIGEA